MASSSPKASPATPKASPKPLAPAPETPAAPTQIAGIAIFGLPDQGRQDPVQEAMDAAVAEHNAAERRRLEKALKG